MDGAADQCVMGTTLAPPPPVYLAAPPCSRPRTPYVSLYLLFSLLLSALWQVVWLYGDGALCRRMPGARTDAGSGSPLRGDAVDRFTRFKNLLAWLYGPRERDERLRAHRWLQINIAERHIRDGMIRGAGDPDSYIRPP